MDMEVEFLNLGLDIIGLGVFNYDFGSVTSESPVIKVPTSACAKLLCCMTCHGGAKISQEHELPVC